MSENVNPNGSIEKYMEDTIIQYLQSQSPLPEGFPYDFNDQGLCHCSIIVNLEIVFQKKYPQKQNKRL